LEISGLEKDDRERTGKNRKKQFDSIFGSNLS